MKRFNVEHIQKLINDLREFNSCDLEKIELYENGQQLNLPIEVIRRFRHTGLNNKDFIACEFYKKTHWE